MPINSVTLNLTNQCNLQCDYCFEGNKNNLSMSTEGSEKIVDWLFNTEVSGNTGLHIVFFGGEPFLKFDLIQKIVSYSIEKAKKRDKWVSFSATTNGTIFSNEITNYWKSIRAGLLLSCDGTPESHNLNRRTATGKGSYKLVEKNFDNLLSITQKVRMTITPTTAGKVSENVDFLIKQGFTRIYMSYDGFSFWNEKDLFAYQEEIYNIGDKYLNQLESGMDISIEPLDTYLKMISQQSSINILKLLENPICGAGRSFIAISSSGVIYPCHRFLSSNNFQGTFNIGNINNGFNEEKKRYLMRIKKRNLLGCDIDCEKCYLFGKCVGGCIALNYSKTKNLLLRDALSRYMEIIYFEVSQEIVKYFSKNPCTLYEKKISLDMNHYQNVDKHEVCISSSKK